MSRKQKYKAVKLLPPQDAIAQVVKLAEGNVPESVVHIQSNGKKITEIHHSIGLRKFPIAVGLPIEELMFSQFFTNLMYLSIMPWDNIITAMGPLADARNCIHNAFLKNCNSTHLLMLDSDVLPPPDLIERLLAHKLPVVGGWYRKKEKFQVKSLQGEISTIQRPVVYNYNRFEDGKYLFNERMHPGEGLEKVDGMGAGCWMIRREVLEKLGESPYTFDFGGEDLTLCRKMTDLGYDIFCDWTISAAHVGVFYV